MGYTQWCWKLLISERADRPLPVCIISNYVRGIKFNEFATDFCVIHEAFLVLRHRHRTCKERCQIWQQLLISTTRKKLGDWLCVVKPHLHPKTWVLLSTTSFIDHFTDKLWKDRLSQKTLPKMNSIKYIAVKSAGFGVSSEMMSMAV